ncbi:hypothetical protein [Microvirga aerophila]|uniref:Uncharacterized protein n=1 Tax=Microvirga aerophila TaxID=670291 RepID=A0A512C1F6_9HYPH|nr:hypothetical protein [Microvirga aerophila]GEO18030.1 hypothetical protein MAE02_57260 [Microvirga aerophila]
MIERDQFGVVLARNWGRTGPQRPGAGRGLRQRAQAGPELVLANQQGEAALNVNVLNCMIQVVKPISIRGK